MKEKKGSSLLETRRRNRVWIKSTIFKREPVTRTAVAEELGLTLPTITTSVNEMMAEGLLQELSLPEERLTGGAGRRPTAVAFRPNAALAVGVELGPYATRAVLMNLRGELLAASEEAAGTRSYTEMLEKLVIQIKELIKKLAEGQGSAEKQSLLGVGVGLPGFIECENGIIRSHREPDWSGRPLAADLSECLDLPVFIDNNVRLRAVGYGMEQRGEQPDSFAYFYISRGLACPLTVKDRVVSGYSFGAGEIGHTILQVENEEAQEKGKQRCLDDLAGERAILQECRRLLEKGKAPVLKRLLAEEQCLRGSQPTESVLERTASQDLEMKQVLKAQEQGDPDIQAVLEETIEYLGIALANVVNLVNPGYVVVDGYLMKSVQNQKRLETSAREKFFGLNEEEVQIVFKPFDHFSGAKGAAYFLLRRLFLET